MPRTRRRRQLTPDQVHEMIEVYFGGEAQVNALVHFYDTRNLWPAEELALADWKKHRMRLLIDRIKDKAGVRIYHHLRRRGADGTVEEVYVNEELFRPEEYAAVQADYYRNGRYYKAIGDELGRRCYLRYGVALPSFEEWTEGHPGEDPLRPPDDNPKGYTEGPEDED